MAQQTFYLRSTDTFNRMDNVPPQRFDANGKLIPAGTVLFVNGVYRTSNPDEQAALATKSNLCTFAEWQATHPQGEKQAYGA